MVVEQLAYCLEVNKHSIRVSCYADLFEKNKPQPLLSENRSQRPAVQPLAGVAWHLQHQGLEKRSSGSDTDRRHVGGGPNPGGGPIPAFTAAERGRQDKPGLARP